MTNLVIGLAASAVMAGLGGGDGGKGSCYKVYSVNTQVECERLREDIVCSVTNILKGRIGV